MFTLMKTLNINISDTEFENYGFQSTNLNFNELLKLINKDLFLKKLNENIEISEKYGLSELTLEDINKEIKEVRRNDKNYN